MINEDLFEAAKSGVSRGKFHNHIIYLNEDEGMGLCSENKGHVHEVTRDLIQEEIPPQPQIDPNTGQPAVDPNTCLLYTSPSPRDGLLSRMPSSA